MLPVAAIGLGANLLGGLFGGMSQNDATQKGMTDFRNYTNQGTNVLEAGKSGVGDAFNPYTAAGATGAAGFANSIQNRTQANQPTLSQSNPQTALTQYLDPSAAYTSNEALKATQASALAKGGMGGGLAKALGNQAQDYAMKNYNNAYQQMLDTGNQAFGQENTIYGNKTAFDQAQIGNYGNLAQLGLGATGTSQQLLGNYNKDINQNYSDIANAMMSGQNQKGKTTSDMFTGLGSNLASGITSIFGGKK